jgi:hypothetical protein
MMILNSFHKLQPQTSMDLNTTSTKGLSLPNPEVLPKISEEIKSLEPNHTISSAFRSPQELESTQRKQQPEIINPYINATKELLGRITWIPEHS